MVIGYRSHTGHRPFQSDVEEGVLAAKCENNPSMYDMMKALMLKLLNSLLLKRQMG